MRPLRVLADAIEDTSAIFYVLDSKRRVIFVNQSLLTWLQVSGEDLLGKRCDYTSTEVSDLSAKIATLCPPPEAFDAPGVLFATLCPPDVENETPRQVAFHSLTGADGEVEHVLSIETAASHAEAKADQEFSRRLHLQLEHFRKEQSLLERIPFLIGESPAIKRLREQISLATKGEFSIALVGEKGVGLDAIARAVHHGRTNSFDRPIIPVECPVLDAELTQAVVVAVARRRREEPQRPSPSLLLKRVDRMPENAQAELLGFLEAPGFSLSTLSTSRRPLSQLASRGKLPRALVDRLSVFEIRVPEIRARMEDIPLLAQWLVERHNSVGGRQLAGLTTEATEKLCGYAWPGNVVEFTRVIKLACNQAKGIRVTPGDLPSFLDHAQTKAAHTESDFSPIDLDAFLAEVEKELMMRAVSSTRGNKTKASSLLGISRARMIRRLAQFGLTEPTVADSVIFEELPDTESEAPKT